LMHLHTASSRASGSKQTFTGLPTSLPDISANAGQSRRRNPGLGTAEVVPTNHSAPWTTSDPRSAFRDRQSGSGRVCTAQLPLLGQALTPSTRVYLVVTSFWFNHDTAWFLVSPCFSAYYFT
jgi:hypothetical protein